MPVIADPPSPTLNESGPGETFAVRPEAGLRTSGSFSPDLTLNVMPETLEFGFLGSDEGVGAELSANSPYFSEASLSISACPFWTATSTRWAPSVRRLEEPKTAILAATPTVRRV